MEFTANTISTEVRAALAPFAITVMPNANNNGFVIDFESEDWCAEQVERYADFIGRMLVDHPERPTIRS